MSFRFRRSIRIAPGIRINLSKSGVSTTVGPRGAKVTIGPRGVRQTVGLPGTGLSYSRQLGQRRAPLEAGRDGGRRPGIGRMIGVIAIAIIILVVVAQL